MEFTNIYIEYLKNIEPNNAIINSIENQQLVDILILFDNRLFYSFDTFFNPDTCIEDKKKIIRFLVIVGYMINLSLNLNP